MSKFDYGPDVPLDDRVLKDKGPLIDGIPLREWTAHQREMERISRLRDCAPELLEALKRLYKVAGGFEEDSLGAALDQALHAIKRAQGL